MAEVSKREEFRVQRWDGKGWRQGAAMSSEEAQHKLRLRHEANPESSLRIIRITTTVEAGVTVGPPVKKIDAESAASK